MKQSQFIIGVALSCSVGSAHASTQFAIPAPLTAYSAGDVGDDLSPDLATDGTGTWIATWRTADPGLGVTGVSAGAFSRSTDDGATWSAPSLIRPEFADDFAGGPSVATDGNGRWIVAYSPGPSRIEVTISDDDGVSWGVPQIVDTTDGNDAPRIATDGTGTWLVAWQSTDSLGGTIGSDDDIFFVRSTNNGDTWSAPAVLNGNAAIDGHFDWDPRFATDGNGVWLVAWSGGAPFAASSFDNGATWNMPVQLSSAETVSNSHADIGTDGAGHWVVVWSHFDAANESFLSHVRSADDGLSWSNPAPLHPYFDTAPPGIHEHPMLLSRSDGGWQVIWNSADPLGGALGPSDADILTSYSRDGGSTWSGPSSLTTRSRSDGGIDDLYQAIAVSPAGRSIAAWASGDIGNTSVDFDIHFSTADRDCAASAREDCLTSTEPDGSKLSIKDSPKGNDRLSWRLKRGQSTGDLQLGDPTTTDDYVLCLYEKVGGTPGLIAEWDAKAATTCRNKPCWTAVSGQVDYKDSGLEQGSIKKMRIRGGADGETSIRLTASGPALSTPRLPLDTTSPVRIQLVNLGTNTCWEGVHDQASKNDDARFSSTSD